MDSSLPRMRTPSSQHLERGQHALKLQGPAIRLQEGELKKSSFERLPYEILMLVFEHLEIANLVTIASVNTYVRGLVQGLADVKKVQHNIYAARAVSRMYTMGTGQFFSLKDFIAPFSSWTYGRCGAHDGFAVRFSLMWCRQICRRTCQSGAIPVEMAV
jgi:F-box domain